MAINTFIFIIPKRKKQGLYIWVNKVMKKNENEQICLETRKLKLKAVRSVSDLLTSGDRNLNWWALLLTILIYFQQASIVQKFPPTKSWKRHDPHQKIQHSWFLQLKFCCQWFYRQNVAWSMKNQGNKITVHHNMPSRHNISGQWTTLIVNFSESQCFVVPW